MIDDEFWSGIFDGAHAVTDPDDDTTEHDLGDPVAVTPPCDVVIVTCEEACS